MRSRPLRSKAAWNALGRRRNQPPENNILSCGRFLIIPAGLRATAWWAAREFTRVADGFKPDGIRWDTLFCVHPSAGCGKKHGAGCPSDTARDAVGNEEQS